MGCALSTERSSPVTPSRFSCAPRFLSTRRRLLRLQHRSSSKIKQIGHATTSCKTTGSEEALVRFKLPSRAPDQKRGSLAYVMSFSMSESLRSLSAQTADVYLCCFFVHVFNLDRRPFT